MTALENLDRPHRLTVFYDGGCPLCRREIEHYRKMRGADRVDWVDITRDPERLREHGLSTDQAMARFHVLEQDGSWQIGAYGFVALWARMPALRWLALTFRFLHLLPLMDRAYGVFARRRLKSRCKDSVCDL